MNNLSANDIKKLIKMAKTKSPEELLSYLSADQSAQVKKIMNNKEMTEKIIKSKTAQDILNKFQNEK